jgi:hypothetical protein
MYLAATVKLAAGLLCGNAGGAAVGMVGARGDAMPDRSSAG